MNILFALLLGSSLHTPNKDTVHFFQVFYNNNKVKDLYYYTSKETLKIKVDSIKEKDSIKIINVRDSDCPKCEAYLLIEGQNQNWVTRITQKGSPFAFSFSLQELITYKKRTNNSVFTLCYFDDYNRYQAMKPVILTIQLE